MSISIGPGGYRPASPDTVLSRRFGDCKDKALLLTTILRELGIEAQPALVNSRRGRVLTSALPTPYMFDHAIVRARTGGEVAILFFMRRSSVPKLVYRHVLGTLRVCLGRFGFLDGVTTQPPREYDRTGHRRGGSGRCLYRVHAPVQARGGDLRCSLGREVQDRATRERHVTNGVSEKNFRWPMPCAIG